MRPIIGRVHANAMSRIVADVVAVDDGQRDWREQVKPSVDTRSRMAQPDCGEGRDKKLPNRTELTTCYNYSSKGNFWSACSNIILVALSQHREVDVHWSEERTKSRNGLPLMLQCQFS